MKPREKPEDFELSSTAHAAKLGEYAWLRSSAGMCQSISGIWFSCRIALLGVFLL